MPKNIERAVCGAIAYTVRGAVAVSGLSRSRIYELIARGDLEARKDGRKTLILADSLNTCIQALPSLQPGRTLRHCQANQAQDNK